MIKNRKDFCVLAILFGLLIFSGPIFPAWSEKTPQDFLPDSREAPGWDKVRAVLRYTADSLFDYINGGAEIYFEYGFEQVAVQDYTKNGHSVSVEIFEMTDPQSAFGIYSFKRSSEGVALETGAEGRLEGYYLNLWKGRYLITITGFDENKETIDGLKALAEIIESKIMSETEAKPALIDKLPEQSLIEGSEKYVLGHLGLYNCYPFSRQNIFGLKEAVKASYREGFEIYIIQSDESLSPDERFEFLKRHFGKNEVYRNYCSHAGQFSVIDSKERLLSFGTAGSFIIAVVNAQSPSHAADIAGIIR